MNKDLMFSSATDLWATPQATFDALNEEFAFTLDVCANADNAKCTRYFTQQEDGLAQEWRCLIPARTDTAWWHDYCAKAEIRFIRGRLKFGGHKNPAPFPSAVVVFRP